jgi:hypothetical protein
MVQNGLKRLKCDGIIVSPTHVNVTCFHQLVDTTFTPHTGQYDMVTRAVVGHDHW